MKGFKTVVFGVLLMLLSIFTDEDSKQFISQNVPVIGSSIGIIVIILRAITGSGIFKKN